VNGLTPERGFSLNPVCTREGKAVFESIFPHGKQSLQKWVEIAVKNGKKEEKRCIKKYGGVKCPNGCEVAALARINRLRLLASLIEAGKYDDPSRIIQVYIRSPKPKGDGKEK
jgi:hypothetical protein